jgi:hypothetical protein
LTRPIFALALIVTATSSAWLLRASAAPPTVTPSPGYDARLQEARSAANAASHPAATGAVSSPVIARHVKKTRHLTH